MCLLNFTDPYKIVLNKVFGKHPELLISALDPLSIVGNTDTDRLRKGVKTKETARLIDLLPLYGEGG